MFVTATAFSSKNCDFTYVIKILKVKLFINVSKPILSVTKIKTHVHDLTEFLKKNASKDFIFLFIIGYTKNSKTSHRRLISCP